jgi:hypothetical protein
VTRVLGWLLLLAAGILSLPVAASLFDEQGSENWILPVQLGGMALVGALVGSLLPLTSGAGSTGRRALVGAALGLAAAVVGVVVFFLLLSGFDGA